MHGKGIWMQVNYDEPITFENLYNCYKNVKKTCKNKNKILRFELNVCTNIYSIYESLKNETYKPKKYNIFKIYEPKPRIVMSQEISDKIVNHFVMNYYLLQILGNKLVDSNVATRENKGTKYADKLAMKYLNALNMKGHVYALKIDISKYFYNIDKDILVSMLNEDIKDKRIINLIKVIISETNNSYINYDINNLNKNSNIIMPLYINNRGLSLGAVTSQFLAIFYLNKIDHFIKENLKAKHYIRYMDDFLIFLNNKEELIRYWNSIKNKLNEFHLCINNKSNIYDLKYGIIFLGINYCIRNNIINIRASNKTKYKIRRKLRNLKRYDSFKYYKSLGSYNGYFKRVNYSLGSKFRMEIIDRYNELKNKYKDTLIIIKDGRFYKTFFDDAKIIHYIMRYKYRESKEEVSFGINAYSNVSERLNDYGISYLINSDDEELLVKGDSLFYNNYLSMAQVSYEKETKISEINTLLKKVIDSNYEKYDEIKDMLSSYLKDN